ncbi:PLAT/LH2 domain-containing protein [Oceanirhabdus sp. W0125-5]|uniref:PLAT/LH2 domain-containing protein n=1 Tax=Oceanirhabdus sp. W0125-5 TaxID=2999116 RepID=UPI0022F2E352|nr:PLAT/LH2 domain-containing protein [Oceanirhabdus sp. W0125-5]WBW97442.1 PLAT/LH2 domain-containing protein [Oceanirhabdus sp. W0125-5]
MRYLRKRKSAKFIINLLLCLSIIASVSVTKEVYAFQPVSHYILMMETAKRLPEDSIIRQAIETYPEIAAIGANGPDLPLIQPGEIFEYSPWSNEYHYFKVGSFASSQLKNALASNDLKQIAYAAGWITHICGDLGAHGIFVNPECGVYLDNPDGRDLHIALETAAEPYIWVNMGQKNKESYMAGVTNYFASSDEIPYKLIVNTSNEIYGGSPSESEISQWITTLHAGLITGAGYTYTEYDTALETLSINNRSERLNSAFYSALQRSLNILTSAESGNYNGLSDRWVLDVGRSDSPISNLTLEIKTGDTTYYNYGTGTDDDVYFGITLKDGTTKEWELDAGTYINDFESGNTDKFYLYIDRYSTNISPENIEKVWLRKDDKYLSAGGDWYPEYIKVYLNSQLAVDTFIQKWITSDNNLHEIDVDLSGIIAVPDEPDPVGDFNQ